MASGRGFGRGRAKGYQPSSVTDEQLRQWGSGFGKSQVGGFPGPGGLRDCL